MKTEVPTTNLVIMAARQRNGIETDLKADPTESGLEIVHSTAQTNNTASKIDIIEGGSLEANCITLYSTMNSKSNTIIKTSHFEIGDSVARIFHLRDQPIGDHLTKWNTFKNFRLRAVSNAATNAVQKSVGVCIVVPPAPSLTGSLNFKRVGGAITYFPVQ